MAAFLDFLDEVQISQAVVEDRCFSLALNENDMSLKPRGPESVKNVGQPKFNCENLVFSLLSAVIRK